MHANVMMFAHSLDSMRQLRWERGTRHAEQIGADIMTAAHHQQEFAIIEQWAGSRDMAYPYRPRKNVACSLFLFVGAHARVLALHKSAGVM
jgi:hypothetical protein